MDGTRPGRSPGLLSSLRQLATTFVGALQTRLELAVTELEEERVRLTRIAVLGVAAALFGAFGLAMFSFFLVVAFWDTHRLLVTGLLALFYFGAAFVAIGLAKQAVRDKPRLLGATIDELKKDRDHLSGT